MLDATKMLCRSGLALAMAALIGGAQAATYEGKPVAIGQGTARVVVQTDKADKPIGVAVRFTPGMLQGLPTTLNKMMADGGWEYVLPMPAKGPRTGFSHIAIDWNPQGHPPPHVYTVPHFDFHFYAMSAADVAKVHFSGPSDPATQVSDKGLVAANYQVIPDTAIDKMGVHAIDTTAPEFHGQPFTATFIYGYYQGRLTFVEPMVTRAYLLKKPDFSKAVPRPAHYSLSGYYPSRFNVRYDARHKLYSVELAELQYEGASLTSLMPAPKGGNQ